MAVTGFFHHMGTFLLLVATALLIVTDISAPVVNDLGILKVDLANATSSHHSKVSFGTFGYCYLDTLAGPDFCSHSHVGYRPARIMTTVEGTDFSHYSDTTTHTLTKVMILHPIATGIVFLAFVLAVGAGFFGSLLAAFTALLAFVVTVVVLVCDFVLFSIIRSNVNDDGTGSHAYYAAGIWTLLVSAVCSLLGTVVIFFTCCSARMHRQRRVRTTKEVDGYAPPATRRRWF
ncbi:pH-response regulator protein palI/prr-5 [Pleurostoma richardsiae]|uniref:PH-response regulator protein palI/prr-5 n=1 Tax=Pleurostoma richardsiae TaxID=41990 RepID=A0AA38SDL4_9PEZI|nr:pH-response regulator protein palI/prr-5 [Pleurostoma richardsiae]